MGISGRGFEKQRPADGGETVLEIEGMMCEHCQARVTRALLSVEGVLSAEASYETGRAVVRAARAVDADALRRAVEDEDYKVTAIHG